MRKIFKDVFYQACFQVVNVLFPVLTIPIVSRALGVENIGFLRFSQSIVAYVVLVAALGRSNYAIREIAYVKDNKDLRSEKFWELQRFNMIFSLPIFSAYLITTLLSNQNILYLIQSLVILAVVFDINWFFQGIEAFKKIAFVNLLIKSISLCCIILLINSPEDLWIYALILSLSGIISVMILWIPLFKYISYKKCRFKVAWTHFPSAFNFFLLKLSAIIFVNANATALGLFSTMTSVGYFSNAIKIVIILGTLLSAINQVLLPKMSYLERKNQGEKVIEVLQKTIHLQLFLTIAMMFGIIAISNHLIVWFLGEDFYYVKNLIPLLAPIIIFQQLHQSIADQYLVPKNEMKLYNITMIIGTIINVVICLILIPFIDVYGAVFGFLLGQIFLGISRAAILVKKSCFKFNWLRIGKWFFSGLMMLTCITFFTREMSSTFITTLIQTLIGIVIYSGITIILKENPIYQLFRQNK